MDAAEAWASATLSDITETIEVTDEEYAEIVRERLRKEAKDRAARTADIQSEP